MKGGVDTRVRILKVGNEALGGGKAVRFVVFVFFVYVRHSSYGHKSKTRGKKNSARAQNAYLDSQLRTKSRCRRYTDLHISVQASVFPSSQLCSKLPQHTIACALSAMEGLNGSQNVLLSCTCSKINSSFSLSHLTLISIYLYNPASIGPSNFFLISMEAMDCLIWYLRLENLMQKTLKVCLRLYCYYYLNLSM